MNAWQRSEPFYFAPKRKGRAGWIAFKDSPSPPPAPDFNASAQQQGEENRKTSLAQNVLGNPNITNPYGSQNVTYKLDPVTGQMQSNVNQSLNPALQGIFDTQTAQNQQLSSGGQHQLDRAQAWANTDFNPNPAVDAYRGSVANAGPMQTSVAGGGPLQSSIAGAGNIQRGVNGIDTSGVAAMPVNAGMTGQNAIMSRLQPQIDRSNAAYQQQLANQGIALGSDAYKTGMNLQGQNNNDLMTQAALQGINLDMAANNQGFNQGLASANFGLNQGQFANAAQQQQFGQNQANATLNNSAAQQQFEQNLGQGNFANAAQGQQYQQNLADANFGNAASQYALQGQEFIRSQPLNEFNAMRSGTQVQVPQFQQYQGAGMTPAPIMQGAQNQASANQNSFNAQQAGANSFNSGLFSLGAAAVPLMFSDRRLKSNIRRIGTHTSGLPLYAYTIFGSPAIGVMADEALTARPDAVQRTSSGILMVNYGRL